MHQKRLITLLATTSLLTSWVFAATLQHIQIEGNKRIETESIKSYLPLKEGEEISPDKMNQAIKDLYATGYFVDVNMEHQGSTLIIRVIENAMINRIAFEGNSKINDEKLKEEIQLRPREVLAPAKIRAAQQRILDVYRRMGRHNAKVEPQVIRLEENRVDLVFKIEEGDPTYIQKIHFVGNKHVSSSKLEQALYSKRARWYRFFASDDTFDAARFEADKEALRKYYLDNGFPDFRLISAVAELSPDGKDFYLTFVVDEGEPYKIGDVKIDSKIDKIKPEDLQGLLQIKPGDSFSAKYIEKSIEKMTENTGTQGYAFAEIVPNIHTNREAKTVDVNLEVKQGPVVYVERIDIVGNERTRDYVIRREIFLHEGDAFNATLLRKSEKRIKDLGYFKNTEISVKQGSSPDKAIVTIKVEEQSTGELNFAAGYSTVDGLLGRVGFSERNFMGKGQIISSEVQIAKRAQDFTLGITEPYFMGKPLSLGGNVFATRSTRFESFAQQSIGASGSFGYSITETLDHAIIYSIHQDKIDHLDRLASQIARNQAGKSQTSALGHVLTYDKRDSKIDPTAGYAVSLGNTYAGLGGTIKFFKSFISGNYYYSPMEDVTMAIKVSYGRIDKISKNSNVRITDSFHLGADTLRGFEYGGIGPRTIDGNKDPVGGTRYWTVSVDTLFPLGLPNELGVKGALFMDMGDLWKPGVRTFTLANGQPSTTLINESRLVRVSAGFGIAWSSPFGPLRIDYSIPVRKAKNDVTQRILFGFKTSL